eukprot:TRINITY_DN5088_c0_g1_i6.p1 TRINITY_DN5088_c0_g1~~TRINITY_DN5088_c0_g1_i6.p1  ORF type:complete len:221 (-),score=37.91 TRINITY_DN5088_c0_g1_i6:72-734(-)
MHLKHKGKRAGSDKQLYHALENQFQAEIAEQAHSWNSDQSSTVSSSPFGPMIHKKSRETLIELISTLNAAFPDYDFSEVRGDQFSKEEAVSVVNQINSQLCGTNFFTFEVGTIFFNDSGAVSNYESIKSRLWTTIDQEIDIKECTIYSFTPDSACNPFEEEGYVWSFNYFFYNKKGLKRIILFTCGAQLKNKIMDVDSPSLSNCEETGDFGMDLMMEYTM